MSQLPAGVGGQMARAARDPAPRPSVAVVIPTYNHARFLGDALTSVIKQTCAADDILVVDDGSTDDPAAVVAAFPGTRLLRRENGGLAAARNTGLAATTASKIVFLDADDLLHPGAIEAGLRAFAQSPAAALVYGAHRRIDAAGSVLVPYRYTALGEDPYLDFLRGNVIGMHATVMYDRASLAAEGGFDVSLRRCEDYDVYLRLARARPMASHAEVVADYRWHDANMSANPADMLQWVLKVHAREKPHVASSLAARRAWRQGRWIWRDYYAEEALAVRRAGPLARAFALAAAARASPGFAARRAARALVTRALALGEHRPPRFGRVNFGDLGTPQPVSLDFGFDRGTPIDRYYIETFLDTHRRDVRGRALEVGDASYCQRFGGSAVTHQDVLHVTPGAKCATFIGDLAEPGLLPTGVFDCMVLTQTLHLIYDMRAAVAEIHRALRPGGVVLATVPGISQLDRGEWSATWSWSLTVYSAQRLFAEFFGASLEVVQFGNVFAATAFLQGVATEEVQREKLDARDTAYPVVVAVRAVKAAI